jgi:hypothetical protein
MKPHPTELRRAMRADIGIAEYRNLYCTHYASCIDVAIRKGWNSFSCVRCGFFAERELPEASSFAFSQPKNAGT